MKSIWNNPTYALPATLGQMDLDDHTGWFTDVEYRLSAGPARGTAERADILSKTRSEYATGLLSPPALPAPGTGA